MNITKILFSVIAAIMIVTNTNATTMCVTNDNTNIILDPSVNGTNNRPAADGTWIVTLQDGSEISGTSTCSSTSGSWANPKYDFNPEETTGEHCWCRMLYPVRSAWVYDMATNGCSSNCAYTCGHHVNTLSDFRRGMYGSAGN